MARLVKSGKEICLTNTSSTSDRTLASIQRKATEMHRNAVNTIGERFTKEEDDLLVELNEAGLFWGEIHEILSERTLESLKSRWKTARLEERLSPERREQMQNETKNKNANRKERATGGCEVN